MKSAQSLPANQGTPKKLRSIKPKPGEVWYIKSDPEALKLTIEPGDEVMRGREELNAYIEEKRRRLGLL